MRFATNSVRAYSESLRSLRLIHRFGGGRSTIPWFHGSTPHAAFGLSQSLKEDMVSPLIEEQVS